MAAATLNDVVEVQKKTLNKVTVIGNILNKNIVPASQQKERDREAGMWKKKLFGFLSGITSSLDGLKGIATNAAKKFPWLLLLGLLSFLAKFLKPLKAALEALRGVAAWLRTIPGMVRALVKGLTGARAFVLKKLADALKFFKDKMKTIASVFHRMRMWLNAARLFVLDKLRKAFNFLKNKLKTIGSLFHRMRMWVNAAKLYVFGLLKDALKAFKAKFVGWASGFFTRIRMVLNYL